MNNQFERAFLALILFNVYRAQGDSFLTALISTFGLYLLYLWIFDR